MKVLTVWGRGLFSLSLVCALLYFVDWRQSLALFHQVDPLPLLLSLPLFPLGIWVSSERWRRLLLVQQLEIRRWQLFRWYWAGAFLSNFLPSNIGGDVSRLAFTRHTGRLAEVAASIVMERLSGFAVLLVFCTVSLALGGDYFQDSTLLFPLWLLVAGAIAGLCLAIFCSARLAVLLDGFFVGGESLLFRWIAKGKKVNHAFAIYRGNGNSIVFCFILSVFFYFLTILAQSLYFCSLDINISSISIFIIAPLISLISSFPISLNSIGLTEGAYVLLFSSVGVPPEESFAVALLARCLQIILSSVGGAFFLKSSKEPMI